MSVVFHDHRNMVFVDGENFTIRGQEYAKKNGVVLEKGEFWEENVFLWMPGWPSDLPAYARDRWDRESVTRRSERAYYYTSVPGGNERTVKKARLALRALDFEPVVFKKQRGGEPSKGVDVTLTTALVSHAYRDDYDVAFLICGEGDYVPVVEEIKRAGKRVIVVFFSEKYGLNLDLRIAADRYIDIGHDLLSSWKRMYKEREAKVEAATRRQRLADERAAKKGGDGAT